MFQFFDGYGYHGTSFEQTYRCYPASFIDKVGIFSFATLFIYESDYHLFTIVMIASTGMHVLEVSLVNEKSVLVFRLSDSFILDLEHCAFVKLILIS